METTERCRGAKYMEGYLEVKKSSQWVIYWVVVRGPQLFFFKDADTKIIKENIQGHVDIGPNSAFASGKTSKGKFEFEVKGDRGQKYLLRASSELLRLQWLHSLGLAAKGKLPPPLSIADQEGGETPGEPEICKLPAEREASNQYTEVPEFNITAGVACEVTDEEMHKMSVKKHNSFSAHCKRLLGRKKDSLNKSIEEESVINKGQAAWFGLAWLPVVCENSNQEDRQPVSEGAEATSEPFYDTFPDEKPAWYFGKLTREQSEAILQKYGPGRFLVRNSESVHKPGAYTLSLKHRDRCRHHKIETLPDGNLVIKQHEDKPFPNLATLMKYFVKSQEKDIFLVPVICENQKGTNAHENSPESYEVMDKRPPAVGCEDKPLSESSNASTPPRLPHGYENLPDKKRVHPPPLKSRMTEPVLPTFNNYQNMPHKADPPVVSQMRTMPSHGESYESMITNGCPSNTSFEEPKPSLPPRRPVKPTGHGYENLPEKPVSPRGPTGEGYVNLPSKSERSVSDPPELPPRSPRPHVLGYENMPSSSRTLPPPSSSYQNIPSSAYSRPSHGSNGRSAPPPMKRAVTLPAHIIEHTLGQIDPINERLY